LRFVTHKFIWIIQNINASLKEGDVKGALKSTFDNMASKIGAVVSAHTGDDKLGKYIELSIAAGGSVLDVDTSKSLTENLENAFFNAVNSSLSFSANSTDGKTTKTLEFMRESFTAVFRSKDFLGKAIAYANKGEVPTDWGKVALLVLEGADVAVSTAVDFTQIEAIHQEAEQAEALQSGTQTSEVTEQLEEIKDNIADLESIESVIDSSMLEEAFKNAAEAKKEIAQALESSMNETLEEEATAFKDTMKILYDPDEFVGDKTQLETIAKLIEQLKKDQAIWDKIYSITSKGASVAKIALKQLGPGPTLIELTKSVAMVSIRAQEWLTWRESRQEAKVVPSPYYTSIENFVKNQGKQLTHEGLKFAMMLLKFGGF